MGPPSQSSTVESDEDELTYTFTLSRQDAMPIRLERPLIAQISAIGSPDMVFGKSMRTNLLVSINISACT